MTKIIAFEGIDGTGKTVQMQRLTERLNARGLRVKAISFPLYDSFFGGHIGSYLSGRDGIRADEVDGKSMALWFALDRFEAFCRFDYSDADVLLINRYVLSNAVYQTIRDCDLGKPDLLEFILELEYEHFRIPRPDVYLVFDVAPKSASANVAKKGFRDYVGDQKDVYESQSSIQERAREKYLDYAARLDHITVVPCMDGDRQKSIDEIAAWIDNALTELFPIG